MVYPGKDPRASDSVLAAACMRVTARYSGAANDLRLAMTRGVSILLVEQNPSLVSEKRKPRWLWTGVMKRPIPVFPDVTVLELKFTTRFPNWFQDLVRSFNLMRFSSAKYAEGVLLLGEGRFHDGDRSFDWEQRRPDAESAHHSAGISI